MLYPRVLRHFRLCRAAAPLLTVTMLAAAAGRLLRGRRAARQCGALLQRSNSVRRALLGCCRFLRRRASIVTWTAPAERSVPHCALRSRQA
jgi:hypothetical protein